jgi:hypothetical protein
MLSCPRKRNSLIRNGEIEMINYQSDKENNKLVIESDKKKPATTD